MKLTMRRMKWEFPLLTVPALIGFADSFQIMGYVAGGGSNAAVAVSVLFKALILAIFYRRTSASPIAGLWFIGGLASALLVSEILSPYQSIDGLARVAGVAVSLALSSIAACGPKELGQYGRSLVNWVAAYSLLYLALAATGQIADHFGRLYYFNGEHPNLCGEINGMAVIVACIVFPTRSLLLRLPILVAPILLVQSRAALLAVLLALGITIAYDSARSARRHVLPLLLGAIVVVVAAYASSDRIARLFGDIFLLNDENRGVGTGFVGRSDRWATALHLIAERPLLGNGPSVYEVTGFDAAHNFILYGFVFLGPIFTVFLFWLGAILLRGARKAPRATAILMASAALMFFNDRFFNFALYPFLFYLFVLSLGAPVRARIRARVFPARVAQPT